MTRTLLALGSAILLAAPALAVIAPPVPRLTDWKVPAAPAVDEPKPGEAEAPAKILERVTQNAKAAGDRLKDQDTGDETRKKQDQVLKDIDELLKQNEPPPPSSGGGMSEMPPPSSDGMPPPNGGMPPPTSGNSGMKPMGMGSGQPMPMGGSGQRPKRGGGSKEPIPMPMPMGGGMKEPMMQPGGKEPMPMGTGGKEPMPMNGDKPGTGSDGESSERRSVHEAGLGSPAGEAEAAGVAVLPRAVHAEVPGDAEAVLLELGGAGSGREVGRASRPVRVSNFGQVWRPVLHRSHH